MNKGGGLILFDIFPNMLDLLCSGVVINEKGKEMLEEKISSYLELVSPKVVVSQNFSFDWIPVLKNPLKYDKNI